MRRNLALLAILLASGITACTGPKVTLAPVAPEDVEVITEEPEEAFEEISNIRQQAKMDTPRRDLIARAREKAALVGADALLTKEYRISANSTNPTVTLLALAIYYVDRHPELAEDPGSG